MKIFNVFILLACVIYSCKTEESKRDFSVQPFSVKDEVVYDLKLDTLLLDSVPTSFVIESDIHAEQFACATVLPDLAEAFPSATEQPDNGEHTNDARQQKASTLAERKYHPTLPSRQTTHPKHSKHC